MAQRIDVLPAPGGPMTGGELRELLATMGVSQKELASFLGVPYRTFTDWLAGGPPMPAAILLRMMIQAKISMADVYALLEEQASA